MNWTQRRKYSCRDSSLRHSMRSVSRLLTRRTRMRQGEWEKRLSRARNDSMSCYRGKKRGTLVRQWRSCKTGIDRSWVTCSSMRRGSEKRLSSRLGQRSMRRTSDRCSRWKKRGGLIAEARLHLLQKSEFRVKRHWIKISARLAVIRKSMLEVTTCPN